MDTRRFLTTLIIAGLLLLALEFLFPGFFGQNKNAAPIVANHLYDNPATQPSSPRGDAPQTITLGDAGPNSKDKLALTVDNVTAGVDLVQLNVNNYSEYPKSPQHPIPEPFTLLKAAPNLPKPYSTLGLHLNVNNAPEEFPLIAATPDKQSDANATALYIKQYIWHITKQTPTEVDMQMRLIVNGAKEPNIEINKVFRIDPASYEVYISHEIRNLSNVPISIAIDQMAATDLPRDNPQADDRSYHGATFLTEKQEVNGDGYNALHGELQRIDGGIKDIGQFNDFSAGKDPLLWIAASNRFFAAITRPLPLPGDKFYQLADSAKRKIPEVSHISHGWIDILAHDESDSSKTVGGIRLTGARIDIPPAASISLPLTVYLGPKTREILDGNPAADPASPAYAYNLFDYSSVIQLSTGSCQLYALCTFNFLATALLWLLSVLVKFMPWHNYGIAIMVMVILVRACLHPLTRMSQINMAQMGKKMKAVQPQLAAAKKRYAKDPKQLQQEQMRIYRENDVNPAGGLLGCLPMLIQMPIWVALYNGLRTDIDLRHAMFFPGWINDLSNPDALVTFSHPYDVPLISHLTGPLGSFNLLPILLGVVFFVQMKVQAAFQQMPTADPSQAKMQKYSQYMILVIPLFLYNAPSGLILYMFASTMGGLVDTYIVRKTLRARGILPSNAPALPLHEDSDDDENEK